MTNNMTNNDNNHKTKYNSINFKVTQNDVTVIFDEVAEQLRLVNFWPNQKTPAKYQGNAKKLLDEYVGRVELAIKEAKKAMQDLLTNNEQEEQSNRAAKNLYLYTKDKSDELTATKDAEKFVKDRVNPDAHVHIRAQHIPNKTKTDTRTIKVSFPSYGSFNRENKSARSLFLDNLRKGNKDKNTNETTTEVTNDADMTKTDGLSWSVAKETPHYMMDHKKKLEKTAFEIRKKYKNKKTRVKIEDGILCLITRNKGGDWTDIDKDTDIDKEMIDIVLGLPKGYSKTEEKETVISNLKSALSNLPKHS